MSSLFSKLYGDKEKLAREEREREREKNRISYFHREPLNSCITGKITEINHFKFVIQAGEKKFEIRRDGRFIHETPERLLKHFVLGATIRIEMVRGYPATEINMPRLLSIRAPHKSTVWR